MSTIAIHRPDFILPSPRGAKSYHNVPRLSAAWTMTWNSSPSSETKKDELSIQIQRTSVPQFKITSTDLRFDRLQPLDQAFDQDKKLEFGNFVARDAVLDEEIWTAAWIRAETHWEDRSHERYADSYKRKFAEQEFNALKRRCKAQLGQRYTCIVTVKKDQGNVRHTVLKSIVGTLDLTIGLLSHGETVPRVKPLVFPGIDKKSPNQKSPNQQYGYVANLCVSKSSRRQGIARNMLQFAITSAKSNGAERVYVHVHRKNVAARELYQKMGFEMIENSSPELSEDEVYLLCLGE